jgi:hypothetical protein
MATKEQRDKRDAEIWKRIQSGESLKSIAEAMGMRYDRVGEIARMYKYRLPKPKAEYYVAYAHTSGELQRLVEFAISHGYELQGGVSISSGSFAQALVRRK